MGVLLFMGFLGYEWYGRITYILPCFSRFLPRRNRWGTLGWFGFGRRLGHRLGLRFGIMVIPRNPLMVVRTPVGVVVARRILRWVLDWHLLDYQGDFCCSFCGVYSINFIESMMESRSSARGNDIMPNRYTIKTTLSQFSPSQVFS